MAVRLAQLASATPGAVHPGAPGVRLCLPGLAFWLKSPVQRCLRRGPRRPASQRDTADPRAGEPVHASRQSTVYWNDFSQMHTHAFRMIDATLALQWIPTPSRTWTPSLSLHSRWIKAARTGSLDGQAEGNPQCLHSRPGVHNAYVCATRSALTFIADRSFRLARHHVYSAHHTQLQA